MQTTEEKLASLRANIGAEHNEPEPLTLITLLDGMEDALHSLKRSAAGLEVLSGAYSTLQNQLQPGQRPRQIPICEFPAGVGGQEVFRVVLDFNQLPDEHKLAVLVPSMHLCNVEVVKSLAELEKMLFQFRQMVTPDKNQGVT